jgi:acetylornithine deacetylase/succinyl-diaminopimelate desuccinylase-like protein
MNESLSTTEAKRLVQYLKIRSIANTDGITVGREWLVSWLRTFCDTVRVIGKKNSLIEASIKGRSETIVCLYGHYDVQPAKKADGWDVDPFSPKLGAEEVVARGACDNKGQNFAFLVALERMVKNRKLPAYTVRIILEGEEEMGSKHLSKYLLRAQSTYSPTQTCILVDGTSPYPNKPAIYTSTLGAVFGEVLIDNSLGEIHSGIFRKEKNGFQPNEVLSTILHDLYTQSPSLIPKLTRVEQWSFSVNFLSSGFSPKKSVVPGKAKAMVSYRFANGITSQELIGALERYLRRVSKQSNIPITFSPKVVAEATSLDLDSQAYRLCVQTMRATKQDYHEGRLPGTLPVASILYSLYGVSPVVVSYGSQDNHTHGAHEFMRIASIEKSISFFTALLR